MTKHLTTKKLPHPWKKTKIVKQAKLPEKIKQTYLRPIHIGQTSKTHIFICQTITK